MYYLIPNSSLSIKADLSGSIDYYIAYRIETTNNSDSKSDIRGTKTTSGYDTVLVGAGLQANEWYVIEGITIVNNNTLPAKISISIDNNGLKTIINRSKISPNCSLEYTEDEGFEYSTNGNDILDYAQIYCPFPATFEAAGEITIGPENEGTYSTFDDDGASGTWEVDINSGGWTALTLPLILVDTDTFNIRRSVFSAAGWYKLTGTF